MAATLTQVRELEEDDQLWRATLFEEYMTDAAGRIVPDGDHHRALWEWIWAIRRDARPRPLVAIFPRGGGKSTTAEQAVVALGARKARRYGWYICDTQDQADDHVGNIAGMLERPIVATFYPELARRRLGKYGSSKGWRRNRLRTASGLTVDALGLDSAARGIKVDEDRPDFMILDDLDDVTDSPTVTERKVKLLTTSLIPAGAEHLAVLAIQNLIHPDSIFAQLVDGRAEMLADRIVLGPIPALENFTYTQVGGRTVITSGTPTWAGQDVARMQATIDDIGITAYLAEHQHQVEPAPGGMFDHIDMAALRIHPDDIPPLLRVACWVDPAVTKSDRSDSHAIQVDGIDEDGTIYRLYSWEDRATPQQSLRRACYMAAHYGATHVGIETDQGGDTWVDVFVNARNATAEAADVPEELRPRIRALQAGEAKAGQGNEPKVHRVSKMLADYEAPGPPIRHVLGTHTVLERALRRFPKVKPFDLADAAYWSWDDLRNVHPPAAFNPPATLEAEQAHQDAYSAPRTSSWR